MKCFALSLSFVMRLTTFQNWPKVRASFQLVVVPCPRLGDAKHAKCAKYQRRERLRTC